LLSLCYLFGSSLKPRPTPIQVIATAVLFSETPDLSVRPDNFSGAVSEEAKRKQRGSKEEAKRKQRGSKEEAKRRQRGGKEAKGT
jgi:hypothetical protein